MTHREDGIAVSISMMSTPGIGVTYPLGLQLLGLGKGGLVFPGQVIQETSQVETFPQVIDVFWRVHDVYVCG